LFNLIAINAKNLKIYLDLDLYRNGGSPVRTVSQNSFLAPFTKGLLESPFFVGHSFLVMYQDTMVPEATKNMMFGPNKKFGAVVDTVPFAILSSTRMTR
jgi:hypothetical protein